MDTPLRHCKLCEKDFPATSEFFHKHPAGLYGLSNVCKPCACARARASEQARKHLPEFKKRQAEKVRRQGAANPEQRKKRCREWRARNPEASKRHWETRQARLAEAGTYTAQEWVSKVKAYAGCCHWCKKPVDGKPVVDHLIPVARGGSNTIENIVPSCRACNQSKHASLPHEFLERRPDLQPLHP